MFGVTEPDPDDSLHIFTGHTGNNSLCLLKKKNLNVVFYVINWGEIIVIL